MVPPSLLSLSLFFVSFRAFTLASATPSYAAPFRDLLQPTTLPTSPSVTGLNAAGKASRPEPNKDLKKVIAAAGVEERWGGGGEVNGRDMEWRRRRTMSE